MNIQHSKWLAPEKISGDEAEKFQSSIRYFQAELERLSQEARSFHPDQFEGGARFYVDMSRRLTAACAHAIEGSCEIADGFMADVKTTPMAEYMSDSIGDRLHHIEQQIDEWEEDRIGGAA